MQGYKMSGKAVPQRMYGIRLDYQSTVSGSVSNHLNYGLFPNEWLAPLILRNEAKHLMLNFIPFAAARPDSI